MNPRHSKYITRVAQGVKTHIKISQESTMTNIPNKWTSKGDISAQWRKIPYMNISLCFFFIYYFFLFLFFLTAYALIINKSNSNGKNIRNEQTLSDYWWIHEPQPLRQPLKLRSPNQCQMMEWIEWYDCPLCTKTWRIINPRKRIDTMKQIMIKTRKRMKMWL